MKTILVPLDGSPLAERVLPSVRMLAPILGANVLLLHIVSEADRYHLLVDFEPDDPFKTESENHRTSWEVLRQNAESYLAPKALELRAAGVDTTYDIRLGAPADIIVEEAEREHVALIAMASHGYSGIKRWALGSVASKVVHATSIPVFIVRGAEQPPAGVPNLKRILVPLDGSALARQALPVAAELAVGAGADISLLTVATPPLLGAPELVSRSPHYDDILVALRATLPSELGSLADDLRNHGVPVTAKAVNGVPADVIIGVAEQESDLIVMATHGYSGLKRWALGSVADKLLRAAATPLVLVRAKGQA
jgi:nucleotide-binding universal stress UspA family protein